MKSDLWALGVVSYEMACLRVPFEATSVVHLVVKVCEAEPEPLPSRYSRPLNGIVFGLLEKQQEKRLSLEELLRMGYARRGRKKGSGTIRNDDQNMIKSMIKGDESVMKRARFGWQGAFAEPLGAV